MTTIAMDERDYKKEVFQKTARPLLWGGMVSIVMLFAALTSAVIVSKSARAWIAYDMPLMFGVSTLVIIISSFTFFWAVKGAKSDNMAQLQRGLLFTLILGLIFALCQVLGWRELVADGVFFGGAASSPSGSYLYALSGLHLGHLIGGLISVFIVYRKSLKGQYGSNNLLGLQLSSTYWHFMDVLWVYLYLFLLMIA